MTRNDLSEEKKKEYDRISDAMMFEIRKIEEEIPHKKGQLDGAQTRAYRQITKKYKPMLDAILRGE